MSCSTRSPALRHLARAASLLAVLTFAGGCSDTSGPDHMPGLYRLASVNGQPLPFLTPQAAWYRAVYSHGDLLVRGDGTFMLGIVGPTGSSLTAGRWRGRGDELTLTTTPDAPGEPAAERVIRVDADSLVLEAEDGLGVLMPLRFVFRRAPTPEPPVTSGTYYLATIDGSTDLSLRETNGWIVRYHRTLFDSLTFMDGVFYRHHSARRDVTYWSATDSQHIDTRSVSYGSYEARRGMLLLRDYGLAEAGRRVDTLRVKEETLARHLEALNLETQEGYFRVEVYSRTDTSASPSSRSTSAGRSARQSSM